jgi:SNF2 family DNA or RNA helicase
LKWWLRTFFENNFDIFCTFVEMCYDERTEMQLKFQHSPNPSVFETTPKVGGTGLTLIVANHAMITQKFWVSNELKEAFGGVVRLGQNRVPHI